MIKKLTRYVSTTSESSEDDGSHPKRQVRMPGSNIQVRQFCEMQPHSSKEGNSIANKSNTGNNCVPCLTRLRSRIPLAPSNSDKSATSETDYSVRLTPKKSLRASSDYDTGTRSDDANGTNAKRIVNSLSLGSNSIQNNAPFECSSDDSSNIQTRSLKRRKTSVINLASSTDSSDSGVPNQVGRALRKKTRLCTSGDNSSTSTDNLSNSNGTRVNAYRTMRENESETDISQNRRIRRVRLRRRPGPIQSRPSSSRQNNITATSEHRIQTRPTRRINGRSGARERNDNIITIPRLQNFWHTIVNSQNPSNASSSNRQRDSRPSTSQQNNTRSIESRQNNVRPPVTRTTTSQQNNTRSIESRQNNVRPPVTRTRQNNRRTSTNGEIVERTTANPTSTRARRQNMTLTGPPIMNDPETGFSLRISIRNGQNITYVHNPSIGSSERLHTNSSSGSSSDDMRPVLRRRRVIFSSDNNTTSSESEASSVFIRRSRRRVQMVISESESAEETRTPVMTSEKLQETILSDSDGETEKCPICFGRFDQQEIGTPKTCEHCFCLECIKKWAENNNTCPVDRRTFNSIIVRANVQGGVIREDVVPPPNNMALMQSDDSFLGSFSDSESDTTDDLVFFGSDSDYEAFQGLDLDTHDFDGPDEICNVCMLSHNAEEMLPCDACDNIYHLQCVDLQAIPLAWICPDCAQAATSD